MAVFQINIHSSHRSGINSTNSGLFAFFLVFDTWEDLRWWILWQRQRFWRSWVKILSSILRRWPVPTPCKRVRELKGYRRRPETIFIRLKKRFCHSCHSCVSLNWPGVRSVVCGKGSSHGHPSHVPSHVHPMVAVVTHWTCPSKSKCRIQVGSRRFQFANKSTFIAPLLLHVKCFVLLQKIHLDSPIV